MGMGRDMNDECQADWLGQVTDQYSGPLVRYAATITGDVDRARDVVQDTLVRLCAEDRARVESHLAEWLFTVCRRRALDTLRKEQRMKPLNETELAACASPEPSPAAVAERRDTHGRVLAVLAGLPKNQQEVVRLKFQNGLSYEEISRVTDLTVSHVGFLIHTAIKTLRRRLQAEPAVIPNPLRRTP